MSDDLTCMEAVEGISPRVQQSRFKSGSGAMNRAMSIAHDTMVAALPANTPPPYRSIDRARFTTKSKIVADVTMFDGLPAVAHFNRWPLGWSHGWEIMEGGDCSFENGEWTRVHRGVEPSLPGPQWSTDMQTAPRGHTEPQERKTKDGVVIDQVWRPDVIWAASKCGKVIKTYFLQPTRDHKLGYWCFFRSDWQREPGDFEQPLAWRPFIEGEFPSHIDPITKTRVYPNGKGPEFPAMVLGVAA